MTAAELRVLEARMDMLTAVLKELIDEVRCIQLSSWASPHPAPGLSGSAVVEGFVQVAADWFEDRPAHELVGLGEVYPADLG
jgi:hypothetical protein